MRFPFSYDLVVDGVPLAEINGVARITERPAWPGQWWIPSIQIDALQGRKNLELSPESPSRRARLIFTEIAVWLYQHPRREEIDEEWREYMARQAAKLVAA